MNEAATIETEYHLGARADEPLPTWLMPYLSDLYLGVTTSAKVRFTLNGGETVREGMLRHFDGGMYGDDIRSRNVRITLLDGAAGELFLTVTAVLELMVVGQFFVRQEVASR